MVGMSTPFAVTNGLSEAEIVEKSSTNTGKKSELHIEEVLACLSEVFHWEAPKNLRRVRARVSEELARVYGFLRMLAELRPEERVPIIMVLNQDHDFEMMMKVILRLVKALSVTVQDAPHADDEIETAATRARNPRGIRRFISGILKTVAQSSRGCRPQQTINDDDQDDKAADGDESERRRRRRQVQDEGLSRSASAPGRPPPHLVDPSEDPFTESLPGSRRSSLSTTDTLNAPDSFTIESVTGLESDICETENRALDVDPILTHSTENSSKEKASATNISIDADEEGQEEVRDVTISSPGDAPVAGVSGLIWRPTPQNDSYANSKHERAKKINNKAQQHQCSTTTNLKVITSDLKEWLSAAHVVLRKSCETASTTIADMIIEAHEDDQAESEEQYASLKNKHGLARSKPRNSAFSHRFGRRQPSDIVSEPELFPYRTAPEDDIFRMNALRSAHGEHIAALRSFSAGAMEAVQDQIGDNRSAEVFGLRPLSDLLDGRRNPVGVVGPRRPLDAVGNEDEAGTAVFEQDREDGGGNEEDDEAYITAEEGEDDRHSEKSAPAEADTIDEQVSTVVQPATIHSLAGGRTPTNRCIAGTPSPVAPGWTESPMTIATAHREMINFRENLLLDEQFDHRVSVSSGASRGERPPRAVAPPQDAESNSSCSLYTQPDKSPRQYHLQRLTNTHSVHTPWRNADRRNSNDPAAARRRHRRRGYIRLSEVSADERLQSLEQETRRAYPHIGFDDLEYESCDEQPGRKESDHVDDKDQKEKEQEQPDCAVPAGFGHREDRGSQRRIADPPAAPPSPRTVRPESARPSTLAASSVPRESIFARSGHRTTTIRTTLNSAAQASAALAAVRLHEHTRRCATPAAQDHGRQAAIRRLRSSLNATQPNLSCRDPSDTRPNYRPGHSAPASTPVSCSPASFRGNIDNDFERSRMTIEDHDVNHQIDMAHAEKAAEIEVDEAMCSEDTGAPPVVFVTGCSGPLEKVNGIYQKTAELKNGKNVYRAAFRPQFQIVWNVLGTNSWGIYNGTPTPGTILFESTHNTKEVPMHGWREFFEGPNKKEERHSVEIRGGEVGDEIGAFKPGDEVYLIDDVGTIRLVAEECAGWNEEMAEYAGKCGVVKDVYDFGTVLVGFRPAPGHGCEPVTWHLHTSLVRREKVAEASVIHVDGVNDVEGINGFYMETPVARQAGRSIWCHVANENEQYAIAFNWDADNSGMHWGIYLNGINPKSEIFRCDSQAFFAPTTGWKPSTGHPLYIKPVDKLSTDVYNHLSVPIVKESDMSSGITIKLTENKSLFRKMQLGRETPPNASDHCGSYGTIIGQDEDGDFIVDISDQILCLNPQVVTPAYLDEKVETDGRVLRVEGACDSACNGLYSRISTRSGRPVYAKEPVTQKPLNIIAYDLDDSNTWSLYSHTFDMFGRRYTSEDSIGCPLTKWEGAGAAGGWTTIYSQEMTAPKMSVHEHLADARGLELGSVVKVSADQDYVKACAVNHGGWNPKMQTILGKTGIVVFIDPAGSDVNVRFPEEDTPQIKEKGEEPHLWVLNPVCLEVIHTNPKTEVSDVCIEVSGCGVQEANGKYLRYSPHQGRSSWTKQVGETTYGICFIDGQWVIHENARISENVLYRCSSQDSSWHIPKSGWKSVRRAYGAAPQFSTGDYSSVQFEMCAEKQYD